MYHKQHAEKTMSVPSGFERHSKGYQRYTLVDRAFGAVHQATGICQLQLNGNVDYCLHTNEEAIYVLEGKLEILRGNEAFQLSTDEYAFIPYGMLHAYRNHSNKVVRWFEAQSPQPHPAGGWQDTFFFDVEWPNAIVQPAMSDPRTRMMGRFSDVGSNTPSSGQGLTVRSFITPELGSNHMIMHRGLFAPGGHLDASDHTVEESFYILSGEGELTMDGEIYHLRSGDVALARVGATHAWDNRGTIPLQWIETITPQNQVPNRSRNHAYWDRLLRLQNW